MRIFTVRDTLYRLNKRAMCEPNVLGTELTPTLKVNEPGAGDWLFIECKYSLSSLFVTFENNNLPSSFFSVPNTWPASTIFLNLRLVCSSMNWKWGRLIEACRPAEVLGLPIPGQLCLWVDVTDWRSTWLVVHTFKSNLTLSHLPHKKENALTSADLSRIFCTTSMMEQFRCPEVMLSGMSSSSAATCSAASVFSTTCNITTLLTGRITE